MDISEEKEHIYSIMQEVSVERRELTNIYFSLKDRLDDLHKLEQRGLDQLSVKGYFDLYKSNDKQLSIMNIKREAMNEVAASTAINKIEKETKEYENVEKEDKIETESSKNISKEIEKEKNMTRSSAYMSLERLLPIIIDTLKNSGKPLNTVDMHSRVNEQCGVYIKLNNFRNNILPRALDKSKHIEKASRGYYQYVS